MEDINVVYADMPTRVRSYVVANEDTSYTIILNSKLSHEQHLISYNHEVEHIKRGDYDKKCSADLIEVSAHSA